MQPLFEVADLAPVEYKLHHIPHAKVFGYFYHHYIDDFKKIMNERLRDVMSLYPNYTVIFTGHSMGAAVSSVACLDAVLSGTVDGQKTQVYNFGQPRISNKAYADHVESHISEYYRIVHNHDIWTHVPPCMWDFTPGHNFLGCSAHGFLFSFYPYHIGSEVLYNHDQTSYQICMESEDSKCSNRFFWLNMKDHDVYLGVAFHEDWKK